jgi:hypothetical protein
MVGIRDLTTEYGESRNATRDEIKKKSNPATSETENS